MNGTEYITIPAPQPIFFGSTNEGRRIRSTQYKPHSSCIPEKPVVTEDNHKNTCEIPVSVASSTVQLRGLA